MAVLAAILVFIIARIVQILNALVFARFLQNSSGIWLVIASVLVVTCVHVGRILLRGNAKTPWILGGTLFVVAVGAFIAGPGYLAGFLFAAFFYALIGAEHIMHAAFERMLHLSRPLTAAIGAGLLLAGGFVGDRFGTDIDYRYVIVFAVAEWVLLTLWTREQASGAVTSNRPPLFVALFIIGFPAGFYYALSRSGGEGTYMLTLPIVTNILGVMYVGGMMVLYLVFAGWIEQLGDRSHQVKA